MAFFKKAMNYLGLGPDDAYDDYDEQGEAEQPARNSRSSGEGASRGGKSSSSGKNWPAESDETVIRAVPARPSFPSRDFESPARRGAPGSGDDSGAHPRSQPRPRLASPPARPVSSRRPCGRGASTRPRSSPTSSRTAKQ